ncbi:hypothetical protein [Engelhardtia mirabilis]|uniref:AAA+ ATPase domain-containing protein n=1 Tax=Engelhardtia mirabilis TaxID=2528011 RepID=A0A518BPR4_9BACT|nr:hypothetical protein Pla133_40830 [Planctomycetes bacterium Pla133]QDV03295.1 hypothetical protein Pla86_40820 [Planctomycetes bacterium Pla86]
MDRPRPTDVPPERDEQPLGLVGFRVRMFRTVRDSGFVPLAQITALVGSQPSGKTTLIRALRGLDPDTSSPYSLERDWPHDRRQRRDADQVPCLTAYRLGESARARLVEQGAVAADACGVRVGRTFAGEFVTEAWCGDPAGDELANGHERFGGSPALTAFVQEHLPRIVHAGHDPFLPGAIAGQDLSPARSSTVDSGIAALASLLSRVGLDDAALAGDRAARRVSEASVALGQALAARGLGSALHLGIDRGRLLLDFELGGVRVPLDELPPPERYRLTLELRLMAAFGGPRSRPLCLLDGPGRFFRGEARGRLHAMVERLAQAGAQVVYTSRLPFDVDLQYSEQVLALTPAPRAGAVAWHAHDAGRDLVVRSVLGMTGRASFRIDELNLIVEGATDELIVKALGRLLDRSGEPGLPDDLGVISAGGVREVVAVAEFLGRKGLGVIVLLDFDDAGVAAYRELREVSRDAGAHWHVQLLQLAPAAGMELENATIEDLFPLDYYLSAAREVCGSAAAEALDRARDGGSEPSTSLALRLSHALEAAGQRYPKAAIARVLEERMAAAQSMDDLPAPLAEAARRLTASIRAAAERALAARTSAAASED